MKSFNFSHFFGRGAVSRLDDDTPDKPDDDPQGKARSRRVEEPEHPDDDPNAEDPDDQDNPDKQGRKGKKAKARGRGRRSDDDNDDPDAEGDDDDGDDRVDDPADKEARMDERHRCARIFSSPFAAANPALAASLAFNTGMSSAAAIQVMASSGMAIAPAATARRPSLDDRMREENLPRLKPDSKEGAGGVESLVSLCNQLKGRG
ncbi:TPA: hypothetical protein ACQVH3_004689 [Serratia marcescens]